MDSSIGYEVIVVEDNLLVVDTSMILDQLCKYVFVLIWFVRYKVVDGHGKT